jgi:hypothetical protein
LFCFILPVDKSVIFPTRFESLRPELGKLLEQHVEVMLCPFTKPGDIEKVGIGDDDRPTLFDPAIGDQAFGFNLAFAE